MTEKRQVRLAQLRQELADLRATCDEVDRLTELRKEMGCRGMADYAAMPCEDPAHRGPDGRHL